MYCDYCLGRQPTPPFGGGPGGPPFGGGPGGPPFGPGGPGGPGMPPPPFGPSGPGAPPFGGGPGGQSGPPSGPPPSFVPQQPLATGPSALAVDPGAIRFCLFRYVYIWLNNGQSFWAWLVFVGPRSVAGWRWIGFRWVFFGTDLRNIVNFVCF